MWWQYTANLKKIPELKERSTLSHCSEINESITGIWYYFNFSPDEESELSKLVNKKEN